ncbi:MAG: chemotaxis protein CheW [Syntrophales bacterium]|nr:chemotaxis protein CheW [Syntrophales bacterium]
MTRQAEKKQDNIDMSDFEEIKFLVFRIKEICFGIDMEQISEIMDAGQAEKRRRRAPRFHEQLNFKGETVVYQAPKILIIRGKEHNPGIIIETPIDITAITVESIQPLPPLIVGSNGPRAIWGVAFRNSEIIMLVDANEIQVDLSPSPNLRTLPTKQKSVKQLTGG